MWQQWANLALGLWLIIVPFLNFAADTLTLVLVVTGAAVAVFGFWGAQEASAERSAGRMIHTPH